MLIEFGLKQELAFTRAIPAASVHVPIGVTKAEGDKENEAPDHVRAPDETQEDLCQNDDESAVRHHDLELSQHVAQPSQAQELEQAEPLEQELAG